jgi:hypothetical protein
MCLISSLISDIRVCTAFVSLVVATTFEPNDQISKFIYAPNERRRMKNPKSQRLQLATVSFQNLSACLYITCRSLRKSIIYVYRVSGMTQAIMGLARTARLYVVNVMTRTAQFWRFGAHSAVVCNVQIGTTTKMERRLAPSREGHNWH